MVPYYLIGKEPFFMKRITEAQIRQVVREELHRLLNEVDVDVRGPIYGKPTLRRPPTPPPIDDISGEYLGEIKLEKFIKDLQKIGDQYSLNIFEVIELPYDRRNLMLMPTPVYFERQPSNYVAHVNIDGDGYLPYQLSPSRSKGMAALPKDSLYRSIQQLNPIELEPVEEETTIISYEPELSGSKDPSIAAFKHHLDRMKMGEKGYDPEKGFFTESKKRKR
jgi:hypothetical protein